MINEIMIAIVLPIVRSIGGWSSKALKDGKISKYEKNHLIETVIRTGIIGTFIYIGAAGYGFDIDIIASSATAIVLDVFISPKKQSEK